MVMTSLWFVAPSIHKRELLGRLSRLTCDITIVFDVIKTSILEKIKVHKVDGFPHKFDKFYMNSS